MFVVYFDSDLSAHVCSSTVSTSPLIVSSTPPQDTNIAINVPERMGVAWQREDANVPLDYTLTSLFQINYGNEGNVATFLPLMEVY